MAGGVTKALFKSAMEPYLPREILYRPKRGFGCPIDRWFRHELKELAYDTLLSQSARAARSVPAGLCRADCSTSIAATRFDHQNRLWALLMLELWFRTWIDAPAEAAVLQVVD